jgi:hypothetical protein
VTATDKMGPDAAFTISHYDVVKLLMLLSHENEHLPWK